MVLFWPDNLPYDAQRWLVDDPLALVERMRDEGKLIWFPCDADGHYELSIFLDCDAPDDLLLMCIEPQEYPALLASGPGYFGGTEYMFKTDGSAMRKYTHMCRQVDIPEGWYAATVWQTNWSQERYETWLNARVSRTAQRIGAIHGTITAWCVIGVIASFITMLATPWKIWLPIVSVTALLIASAVGITRTRSYRQLAQARSEFSAAYPSYVVRLRSLK